MARLIYGSGVRLMGCLRLRMPDLELERRALIVRNGKGAQDRVTVLSDSLVPLANERLQRVKALNMHGLASGYGAVYFHDAVARLSPRRSGMGLAIRFPGQSHIQHPRSGVTGRHHLHESSLQEAMKEAARSLFDSPGTGG